MNKQYTLGRLRLFDKCIHPEILDANGEFVASVPRAKENYARRLAACWNACEGIDTDDLEAHSVNIIHKLHDDAAKRVLSERDELLEALLGCIAAIERTAHCTEADRLAAADKARATLTKHQPPATPAAKTS